MHALYFLGSGAGVNGLSLLDYSTDATLMSTECLHLMQLIVVQPQTTCLFRPRGFIHLFQHADKLSPDRVHITYIWMYIMKLLKLSQIHILLYIYVLQWLPRNQFFMKSINCEVTSWRLNPPLYHLMSHYSSSEKFGIKKPFSRSICRL